MTLTLAGEPLIAYLLASVRIIAWFAIVPPFSSRAVPVMAVSANAMPSDVERGIAAGFADYLTKPLDMSRLIASVEAVLVATRSTA